MILLRLINKSSCLCISERQRGCKAEPVVHSLSLSPAFSEHKKIKEDLARGGN